MITSNDFMVGKLKVRVFENVDQLSEQASLNVAESILNVLKLKNEVNIFLSGAESQDNFLHMLFQRDDIDWSRVNYFAVDEFYEPKMDKSYCVAAQILRIVKQRPLKSVNIIDCAAKDIRSECDRYEELVRRNKPDIACLGIGLSGHLAFNEPGQTNFTDTNDVQIIQIDDSSINQLLKDPNFNVLESIPKQAITVTIPFLMRTPVVSVVVPYKIKAPIVEQMLKDNTVTEDIPATILKEKENAVLYLDHESYSLC